jgi:mRNA (guanine-N7-)-methyltransferase
VDDDIAIERESISLKCPLTLVMFVDPVSSTKCVHSFERQAIEDMINQSSMTVPAGQNDYQGGGRGARARRVRAIACPVCSVKLTLNDLKRDPVIMTRVRRARAAKQRDAEEADFERDDGRRRHLKGGRRSGFTVASDDEEEDAAEVNVQAERMIRIKQERSRLSSRAPQEDIEDD